jgi:hypothetical protein
MEVIGILEAVKSGIEVLGWFANLVGRYRGFPDALLDIHESFKACEYKLEMWKTRWGVRNGRPMVYFEVFWGKNGWQEIRMCLGGILKIARQIKEATNELIDCVSKYDRNPSRRGQRQDQYHSNNRYNGQMDEQLLRNTVSKIGTRLGRWNRFKKALTNKAEDLENQVRRFDKKLRNLRRICDGNLNREHPDVFRHKHGKALLRITDKSENSCRTVRDDAKLLYEARMAGREIGCRLSFYAENAVAPNTRQAGKDFQMKLKDGSWSRNVQIHPVRFTGSTNSRLYQRSLSGALTELRQTNFAASHLLPPSSSYEQGFTVRMIADRPTIRQFPNRPLDASFGFGRRSKALVARTIAQGCYRLLGSPWLDSLDVQNIQIWVDGNSWAGALDVQAGDRRVNEALERMVTNFRRGDRSLEQHCHIYRLGLILAGIALGVRLTHVVFERNKGLSVVLERGIKMDAAALATEVETEMDVAYADAVDFCLSVAVKGCDWLAMTDLDLDFEQKILKP